MDEENVGRDDSVPFDRAADLSARHRPFEVFYKEEVPHLVGHVMVLGAQAATAADIAQAAMTEAFRRWGDVQNPRAFVRKVADRTWWRVCKAEREQRPQEHIPEVSGLLADEALRDIEVRHTFLKLIRSLPEAQREVLAWAYDGYGPGEIATLIGKPAGTVRSLLHQAREALRAQRRPDEEES